MLVIASDHLTQFMTNDIQTYLETLTYHLFQNNITATTASRIGDFTESTFPGYVDEPTSTWTAPVLAGAAAVTTAAQLVFSCSGGGGQDVYGYYVTDPGGTLVFSERYAGAPVSMVSGANYAVNPYFSAIDQV
jgi:hypothetical protein